MAIGDAVTVDGRAGKVLEYRKRGLVRVEYEDGDGATADVDASTVEVVTPVAAIDVTESFSDAQEKAAAPLDDCFLELPPDQLAEISAMIKFEAPSAEALACLPRVDDEVKVCDGEERFWTVVRKVDGDKIEALVVNALLGGQEFAKPGTKIAFEKRHIYMIQVHLSPDGAPTEEQGPARFLGRNAAVRAHFMAKLDQAAVQLEIDHPDKPELQNAMKAMKHFAKGTNSVPVPGGPLTVAEWLRAEAKRDPSILDGTGLTDPEDIGVFRMSSLERIAQIGHDAGTGPMQHADTSKFSIMHDNLMNMSMSPRVVAVIFDG